MIYDAIENLDQYFDKAHPIHKAVTFVRNFDLSQPDGTYEIDGRKMYAMAQSYETAPAEQKKFETHVKYIDVQILVQGEEACGISLGEKLEELEPYKPEKDVTKHKVPPRISTLAMKPGVFAVFYPQDAHRPNCNLNGVCKVRKIVVKVAL